LNAGIYPPSSQSVAAPLAIGGAAARPVQMPGGIDNSLDWRKTSWASMQDSVQSQARARNWRYGTVRTAATVTAVTTNYVGSVLGLGGLALACPFVATSALVFDSNNNRTYNVGSFGGSSNFTGGVLMPDGSIFIAPRASTTARIVDLSTNTVTTPNCTFPGNQVYIASCLFDGGRKIYLAPYLNTTTAGVYDIQRQTLSVPAGTFSTVSGQGAVSSGALLLPDGRVFVAPLGSTACIYDPVADSLFTSSRSLGSVSSFFGAVLLPSGDEIALIPQGATALVIYNWRRDTVRTIPGTCTGHIGGQLAPDGTVFLIPGTSTVARVYDPVTDTLRNLPDTFSGNFPAAGAHGLPDGRLVMLARSDSSVFTYGTLGTPVDANIQLSAFYNHR